jgi:hypothetical protein
LASPLLLTSRTEHLDYLAGRIRGLCQHVCSLRCRYQGEGRFSSMSVGFTGFTRTRKKCSCMTMPILSCPLIWSDSSVESRKYLSESGRNNCRLGLRLGGQSWSNYFGDSTPAFARLKREARGQTRRMQVVPPLFNEGKNYNPQAVRTTWLLVEVFLNTQLRP